MRLLKLSTGYVIDVFVNQAADPTAPLVGADPTAWDWEICKQGGAFANLDVSIVSAATGVGRGWYRVTLTTAETNTLGSLKFYVDASADSGVASPVEFWVVSRLTDDLAFPVVSGRGLDVTATGAAGIDFANVENPTTTVNLSGTTIKTATDVETDTVNIQSRIPAALDGDGNIKAGVQSVIANAIDAASIAANAITDLKIATGAFTAAKFAASAITSTVLADGAITVNKLADGAISAAKFAANAIDATALATTAVTEIVTAIFDELMVAAGITFREQIEYIGAALVGKGENMDGVAKFYSPSDDTQVRVESTISGDDRPTPTLTNTGL